MGTLSTTMAENWTRDQLEALLKKPLDDSRRPQDVVQEVAFPQAHHLHWSCGCRATAFAPNLTEYVLKPCDVHRGRRPQ